MNKHFNTLSFMLSAALLSHTSFAFAASLECEQYIGCEKKFCDIEEQISIAQSKGNTDKVDGLTVALNQSKSSCSAQSLNMKRI